MQRLRDQYIQSWNAKLHDHNKLCYYRTFTSTFEMETYLTATKNNKLQMQFARFRLSSHKLNICSLKSARVIPLFKKNHKTTVGNYRPVSILKVAFQMRDENFAKVLKNHPYTPKAF